MIEDKLTQEQRIRLEAVALSVHSTGGARATAEGDRLLLSRANKIEKFIRDGEVPT